MLETNSLFSFDVKEVAAKLLIYRRKMCRISSNILGNLEVVSFFFVPTMISESKFGCSRILKLVNGS